MKPVDLRNETFESLQGRLNADLKTVLQGYKDYGPCTTEGLALVFQAQSKGIGLLTVRPRTTDLCALGLVVLDVEETRRLKAAEKIRCGVYRAATDDEIRAMLARAVAGAPAEQLHLSRLAA
jgi:hypothetical protein